MNLWHQKMTSGQQQKSGSNFKFIARIVSCEYELKSTCISQKFIRTTNQLLIMQKSTVLESSN